MLKVSLTAYNSFHLVEEMSDELILSSDFCIFQSPFYEDGINKKKSIYPVLKTHSNTCDLKL